MELLAEIVIPDFIQYIQLSKARREKYYTKGQKIPKKYKDESKFGFLTGFKGKYNNTYFLTDLSTGKRVIANSRTAGKPKMLKINGNSFYVGFSSYMIRDKVVDVIKESILPYFQNELFDGNGINRTLKEISFKDKYPLYICFEYHDIKQQSQDIDNKRYIYEKCTLDLLQKLEIIPNDNVNYITKLSSEYFESDEHNRKLVIKFYSNKK